MAKNIKKKKATKKKAIKKKSLIKKKQVKSNIKNNQKIQKNRSLPTPRIEEYGIKFQNIFNDSLLISSKSIIEGAVHSPKTILVYGEIHGTIKSINVYLTKNSKVSGSIIADNIFLEGLCGADIQVKKFCHIKSSAIVKGDINYDDNISIDVGARILGRLIPKKKPLALPNYTKSSTNNFDTSEKIDPLIENEKEEIHLNRTINKKGPDSFDKIIKKIFK